MYVIMHYWAFISFSLKILVSNKVPLDLFQIRKKSCISYKMSKPVIKRLIDLKLYYAVTIKLILDELNLITTRKIKIRLINLFTV